MKEWKNIKDETGRVRNGAVKLTPHFQMVPSKTKLPTKFSVIRMDISPTKH